MKSVKYLSITFSLLLFYSFSFGQFALTQSSNAQQLGQALVGSGVQTSNFTMTCGANGAGLFTNGSNNLGIMNGIVLTTGNANAVGQNGSVFASTNTPITGDANLNSLTVANTQDKCILEFDVVPNGNVLSFNYAFASEEYPEYVCSNYNDVFGFFISGPNPTGGSYAAKNIAIVPSTILPVAINTVNPGVAGAYGTPSKCQSLSNAAYYINNLTGTGIVYDGITTLQNAIINVVPCQSYHLKLAIADVGDGLYDSGIFIEGNSITSPSINIVAAADNTVLGNRDLVEGCINGTFTFSIPTPATTPTVIHFTKSGNAINGVDFMTIGDSIIIPAGSTSAILPITALVDNMNENADTIILSIVNGSSCGVGGTISGAYLVINDKPNFEIFASTNTTCVGKSVQLSSSVNTAVNWSSNGLTLGNTINYTASPTQNSTYIGSIALGTCNFSDSAVITIANPVVNITAPSGFACDTTPVVLNYATDETISNVLWSNGATTDSILINQSGLYSVEVTNTNGCKATATFSFAVYPAIDLALATTNPNCSSPNSGHIDLTVLGGTPPFVYVWSNGSSQEDVLNAAHGSYDVLVVDKNGCQKSASANISAQDTISIHYDIIDLTCNNSADGQIICMDTAIVNNVYSWSNGGQKASISNLSAGNYTLTVTNGDGCNYVKTFTVNAPAPIAIQTTTTNPTCFNGTNGNIATTVTGGNGEYSYLWSNSQTSATLTNVGAGNYNLIVTDKKNCSANNSAALVNPTAIIINETVENASCKATNSGSIALTVQGGNAPYSYAWSNQNNQAINTDLEAGNYSVIVKDVNNCEAIKFFTINAYTPFSTSETIVNNQCDIAKNGSIAVAVVGNNTPFTFEWSTGASSQEVSNLSTGSYTLTVSDKYNCEQIKTFQIISTNDFSVSVSDEQTISLGQTATLAATTNSNATFEWTAINNFQQDIACATCGNTTASPATNATYSVKAINEFGCVATATIKVNVTADYNFWMPNAFSPNNDGNNDVLETYGNKDAIKKFQLLVYNKIGEKMFETNDPAFKWDGIYKGAKMNPGAYAFFMNAVFTDGKTISDKGSIAIVF